MLSKYRQQGVYLDSIRTLTWGRRLVSAGALASPISAATGVFTAVCTGESGKQPIIGQVNHANGSPYARFMFLAPESEIDSPGFSPLLENLIRQIGERGAENLIADVDEKSEVYEALREMQFSIYARQRIWQITELRQAPEGHNGWRDVLPIDEINVRKIYNELVPGLVQQVEPAPWDDLRGYAFYHGGNMRAFAQVVYGPYGKWVQPFIHPEMQSVSANLRQLVYDLKPSGKRPVYICLRSYQAWLSSTLEDMQAEIGPPQAVMVRRLAVKIKKPALSPIPQINGNTEPTTTFYNVEKNSK
jgi:hypothetical protein